MSCLRREHILSVANSYHQRTDVLLYLLHSPVFINMNCVEIYVEVMSPLIILVFVVFLGIAVHLLCVSIRFYTLCWNVTGCSFLSCQLSYT